MYRIRHGAQRCFHADVYRTAPQTSQRDASIIGPATAFLVAANFSLRLIRMVGRAVPARRLVCLIRRRSV